jgi:hypothetical protein
MNFDTMSKTPVNREQPKVAAVPAAAAVSPIAPIFVSNSAVPAASDESLLIGALANHDDPFKGFVK